MDLSAGVNSSDVGASQTCSTRMLWILRSLCFAGLAISAYLAWTALNMVPVYGCGGGGEVFDCGHVLTSKWSKVWNIPVSVPACGLYLTLLGMLSVVRYKIPPEFLQMVWNGLTVGATMAGLAALWFIGLQVFVLDHLCPYCLAVHSCGIILAVLLLRNSASTWLQKSLMASVSAISVAVLMAIQINTPTADNVKVVRYDEPESTSAADSGTDVTDADVFEAPGEVFEAPGAETDSSQVDTPRPDPSKDAVKEESTQPVASNLLLIIPPRYLMLSNLPGYLAQEAVPADQSTAPAGGPETPDGDKKEKSGSDADAAAAAKPEDPAKPERRLIAVAGNKFKLDVRQWPLLGKPDARYVFVEMFDYTCQHCRSTHSAIKGALDQYGDDLAVVALPVPLDPACNSNATGGGHAGSCELSRIAVAVWRVDPGKFREFHDWMFASIRTPAAARTHAEALVGVEKFKKEFSSQVPADFIKRHIQLYVKVGQGSVPKLMFPNSTMTGEVNNKETLVRTIEAELK